MPALEKEFLTVAHAEFCHSVVGETWWNVVMAQHGSQRSFALRVLDSFIDCGDGSRKITFN